MIVIDQADGSLLVVAQPDHARTCAQIMQAWRKPLSLKSVWRRVIDAADHHDDGWRDVERHPTFRPDGRPHDFKSVPTEGHVAIWRESIEAATRRDAYVGLLMALHARWLYTALPTNHAEDTAVAQAFVDELANRIDDLIDAIRNREEVPAGVLKPSSLLMAQRLISFTDALSLALLGAITLDKTEPLGFGDAAGPLIVRRDGEGVVISPWPFTGESVVLMTEARCVPIARFDGAAAFLRAIEATPAHALSWTLRPD